MALLGVFTKHGRDIKLTAKGFLFFGLLSHSQKLLFQLLSRPPWRRPSLQNARVCLPLACEKRCSHARQRFQKLVDKASLFSDYFSLSRQGLPLGMREEAKKGAVLRIMARCHWSPSIQPPTGTMPGLVRGTSMTKLIWRQYRGGCLTSATAVAVKISFCFAERA